MSKSVSVGSLRPITVQCTRQYKVGKKRYEVGKKVQRQPAIIEPGMFLSTRDASPTYLPPQWSALIHPEGKIYFHRNSGLNVVTDSYMYTPTIGEQICTWALVAEKMALDKGFVLTNDVELFLQLDGEDCNYYLIDRATKTLFWLEQHESSDFNLHPTISIHSKEVLEAEYWSHIERFCMHFGGLPQKDIDDLILVFSHALTGTLTSFVLTFPYDAAACERFLNLLISSRDRIHEGYITCDVARLWGVVAYNRYYGQEQSRLSRNISILVDENADLPRIRNIIDYDHLPYAILKDPPTSIKNMKVDMFSKASNVSMNETEIVNAGGDVTINHHNHFYLPQSFSDHLPECPSFALVSAAVNRVPPLPAIKPASSSSQLAETAKRISNPGHLWSSPETKSEQTPQPLLPNAQVIQTKISMCTPGSAPKILYLPSHRSLQTFSDWSLLDRVTGTPFSEATGMQHLDDVGRDKL